MKKKKKRSRARRRNPNVGGAVKGTLNAIPEVLIMAGGVIANSWLTNRVVGIGVVPDFFRSGFGKTIAGLVVATGFGMGAKAVLKGRKEGSYLATGAVLQTVSSFINDLVPAGATQGFGDFATVRQVQAARSIDGSLQGMGDFATVRQVNDARSIDGSLSGMSEIGDFMHQGF